VAPGTATWDPGTRPAKTFDVTILPDAIDEANETFI